MIQLKHTLKLTQYKIKTQFTNFSRKTDARFNLN